MTKDEMFQLVLKTFFALSHQEHIQNTKSFTEGEKGIMGSLYRNYPTPRCSGELAETLQVGTGRIGNALKSLEKKGLIQRQSDPQDKRKVIVSLTDKGYSLMKEETAKIKNFFYRMMDDYGEEKFVALMNDLQEFIHYVDKYKGDKNSA